MLIPGGSGSFGQIAVPLAKAMGLNVIVTGNARMKDAIVAAGADQYLDYRTTNYWETLSDVDYVIDTLGASEMDHELSVLNPGGKLMSLRTMPNGEFAHKHHLSAFKRLLFTLAGLQYDRKAKRAGKSYHFMYVRAHGAQLHTVATMLADRNFQPQIDPHHFTLTDITDALSLVHNGHPTGKVILHVAD